MTNPDTTTPRTLSPLAWQHAVAQVLTLIPGDLIEAESITDAAGQTVTIRAAWVWRRPVDALRLQALLAAHGAAASLELHDERITIRRHWPKN
jgi:hypothetical protein